ncbi:DUF1643 domain-containing protein [Cyclobacterium xiamenense]|uniref:DUF1643 domain-containing protein n=1 Tax=Cyclobacterium xiamenense TaxID=1297121 RepID=UPI0035D13788
MDYNVDIYEGDSLNRFVLSTKGSNPLFVIGLNPNKANDETPDHTIKKVHGFAIRNNYDSFMMLNLYAQRTLYPEALHKEIKRELHQENITQIQSVLKNIKSASFLAAWGGNIKIRSYLLMCLNDLVGVTSNHNINWIKIGDLTKSLHPRHPSRPGYNQGLSKFDLQAYMKIQGWER